jgi:5-methylcytosine-specific restriction endonuclease McrA
MATTMRKAPQKTLGKHGMNWIRQEKRFALYMRDDFTCAYCGGTSADDGIKLTLDHLKPRSKGGSNAAENLVTCCLSCNSARGNRTIKSFAKAVAAYVDADAADILSSITDSIEREIPKAEAKERVEWYGSAAKALEALS